MTESWPIGRIGQQGPLCLGVDLGSVSLKVVVTDPAGNLLGQSYTRTQGRPVETAITILEQLFSQVDPGRFELTAGTGSAGRLLCQLLEVPFVNELICQAVAIKRLHPAVRTLIEMGGQDSKIIFLPTGDAKDRPMVDFAMNTNCAAGTGSFLDQQASRLGIRIEDEFGQLALKSKNPPRVAGRCSVFAKSDMIHLQQQATPLHDIVAGLCMGLARNLKSNLARGRPFDSPIAFCGGVAANKGVVHAFETVLETGPGGLIVPSCHAVTGALGAVLVGLDESKRVPFPSAGLQRLREHLAEQRTIGHRLARLEPPSDGSPESKAWALQLIGKLNPDQKIEAYLGVDVGSISTNVVALDRENRVLAKAYLMTAGRPLDAVRLGLAEVGQVLGDRVRICGAATTGSGRYLTGDFIGADLVINEITAQATAAALIDPEVDTIFEIGGQDSKYISLDNGVVVDFEMNHACAAGTGSFLEEQAERLGINIKEQFGELALTSQAPIRLGERCTVFMESDLLSYQQQGADTDDLVAGLAYSIVTNYLNRVVGHRRIGRRIFFQGGTAFNKAVVSAFENRLGHNITVPPHHEVTGAIGAAALARRWQERHDRHDSKFHGFDLAKIDYQVRTFECTHCPNNCEIKEVTIPGRDPLYYGSRCDRYNVKKDAADRRSISDLFAERHKLLLKYCNLPKESDPDATTVGLPLTLSNYQLAPFWSTLLCRLGVTVVLSGASTKELIRRGVESVLSTPCFPVKVAHGHILALVDKGVDYIWLPSITAMPRKYEEVYRNQLCPYVQAIPYQVQVALEESLSTTKLLKLPVRMDGGPSSLVKYLEPLCRQFGVSRKTLSHAVRAAEEAQQGFESACRRRGREALDNLDQTPGQRAVVIVSRPYNGCDPGVSLDLPNKLRKLGVLAVPMDFLDLDDVDLGSDRIFANMYWQYGQLILRAARAVRSDQRLHAVYLSNFSCGPDSFIISYFKKLMGAKPALVLEIDEHSADVGVVTRLEAFLESLSGAEPAKLEKLKPLYADGQTDCSRRTLYIPWMGDASYALASSFRACGQPAEVLPLADDQTLEVGRRFTCGKECLPCIITTGDMVKKVHDPHFDRERSAFFMPGGSGPCRFGQYNCMQKLVLSDLGLDDVPVVSPSQDSRFYNDFKQFRHDPTRLAWYGIAACDLLHKVKLLLRPYELQPGCTDQVYQEQLDRLCELIETDPTLHQLADLMARSAKRFAAVELDRHDKPKIGVVGEIYVRCHDFANNHVVRQLESLGAEIALASFSEWMYYTNETRMWAAKREHSWYKLIQNSLKNRFQHNIERRLAKPFEPYFGRLVEPVVRHILELARPYIHQSFEGEAVLSVGKTIEFCHEGCDGVVNVMPFTCMPSTIVSGVMKKVSTDLGGMPIISISYDGQQDPTLETRLEAFVHQARAYRRLRKRRGQAPPDRTDAKLQPQHAGD